MVANRLPVLFRVLPFAAGAESEIQLCRTGDFFRADTGHFRVTRKTLEKMIRNARERGVDIPVNYHHRGSDPSAPNSDRDAAGWVSPESLYIRAMKEEPEALGVFGKARWTKAAVEKIRSGALRYISPEIVWSDTRLAASDAGPAGKPIGASLVGAALVNDPFFRLEAVSFARAAARLAPERRGKPRPKRYSMLSPEKLKALIDAMGAAGLSEEEQSAIIGACTASAPEAAPVEEMAMEEEEEMMASQEPAPAAPFSRIASLFGLSADASEAQIATVARAQSRQLDGALKRLSVLESDKKARDAQEREALFAAYQREGKLRFADEKEARQLLDTAGPAAFRAAYGRVPAITEAKSPGAPRSLPNATTVAQGQTISDADVRAYARDKSIDVSTVQGYKEAASRLAKERLSN